MVYSAYGSSNQFDDNVFIQINAGGTFNRNGRSDTIYNFVNNGGTYLSGRGGTFTVIDPDWIAVRTTFSALKSTAY